MPYIRKESAIKKGASFVNEVYALLLFSGCTAPDRAMSLSEIGGNQYRKLIGTKPSHGILSCRHFLVHTVRLTLTTKDPSLLLPPLQPQGPAHLHIHHQPRTPTARLHTPHSTRPNIQSSLQQFCLLLSIHLFLCPCKLEEEQKKKEEKEEEEKKKEEEEKKEEEKEKKEKKEEKEEEEEEEENKEGEEEEEKYCPRPLC
jgi:hypothetical protein